MVAKHRKLRISELNETYVWRLDTSSIKWMSKYPLRPFSRVICRAQKKQQLL